MTAREVLNKIENDYNLTKDKRKYFVGKVNGMFYVQKELDLSNFGSLVDNIVLFADLKGLVVYVKQNFEKRAKVD